MKDDAEAHEPVSGSGRLAGLAMSIFAVDPMGNRGLWLRSRSGPVRDHVISNLSTMIPGMRKVPPDSSDTDLFGGVDLGAVLAAGKMTVTSGLLSREGTLVLPMAERCALRLAAHTAHALDNGTHAVLALDEGAASDEVPPHVLTERLGLFVDLDGIRRPEDVVSPFSEADVWAASQSGNSIVLDDQLTEELVHLAVELGIESPRACFYAIAAAKAHAALSGRDRVTLDDVEVAVALTFAHRARPPAECDGSPQEQPDDANNPGDIEDPAQSIPSEMLVEAARAAVPKDVLDALSRGKAARNANSGGSGAAKKGAQRGRPLPSRPGRPGGSSRIDVIGTLHAAAPWQRMRGRTMPEEPLRFERSDLRVRRFEERSDRLLIFTVDASGSQAMARLAEVKGAVEILLSEAYARRDQVALIAFRGDQAELLLPPTRSLVQTKRKLSALPGGGGTPLAAGIKLAEETCRQAKGRGLTPTIVLLTDGRANVALDGQTNRTAASDDVTRVAGAVAGEGIPVLVIDTAMRPSATLAELSRQLHGEYVALPRADSRRLSQAVSAALQD